MVGAQRRALRGAQRAGAHARARERRPRTRRRLPERRADRRLGAAHRPALDGHRSGHRRAAAVRGRTRPAPRLGARAAVPRRAFRLRDLRERVRARGPRTAGAIAPRDAARPQAGRRPRRPAPEPLLPDRVPQPAALHGLPAAQAATRVLEALAGALGARFLLGDDSRSAASRRRHGLRADRAAQLQLPARGHPAARALGGASARASDARSCRGRGSSRCGALSDGRASGSSRRSPSPPPRRWPPAAR